MINATGNDPDAVLDLFNIVLAPAVHALRQPALPRVDPRRADQGVDAVRRGRVARVDQRRLVDRVRRRGMGRERGPAFHRRPRGHARVGRRHVRAGRLGREPVRVGRRARHRTPPPRRRRTDGCSSRSPTTRTRRSATRCTCSTSTRCASPSSTTASPATRSRPRSPRAPTRRRCARSSRTPGARTRASSTISPASPASATNATLWMHVDAAYGGGALLARSTRPLFAGIERADSLVVDPHKWLYAPLDCAALLYRDPRARAHGARPACGLSRLGERGDDRLEPGRLRVPAHAARPRAPVLVLARGARLRRVPRRGRTGARDHPGRDRAHPRALPPRDRARAGALGRAVPAHRLEAAPTTRPGRRSWNATRSRSSSPPRGTTRRSRGSRSCTPTRRSTSSTRSSPPRLMLPTAARPTGRGARRAASSSARSMARACTPLGGMIRRRAKPSRSSSSS